MDQPINVLRRVAKRAIKQYQDRNKPDPGPLPVFMDPIEYSQLIAVVETLAPKRVLEWGSGGSTRALLERCDFIETFVSIEHHALWYERVQSFIQDERLQFFLKEPTEPEPNPSKDDPNRSKIIDAWWTKCEQDPSILADYVAHPRTLDIEFDFVLVDGRARTFCIREGFQLLRPGGVLIVHDAQREQYHPALHEIGSPVFLEPWKQGQICLVRKPNA